MEQRRLGDQGLEVSKLGLGCMNLSVGYGAAPVETESLAVLARAVELGVTLFDTAEMYGPFKNESLLGRGLSAVRDRVVIATKFGFDLNGETGRPLGVNSKPQHIREVCDASLQRLGLERINLFYQHRVDPKVPIEDVAGCVKDLVQEGKVEYFGLSEAGPETLRKAHAVHRVSALQSEYSLWSRGPEKTVLPVCRELNIGFVPYSPLGRGFLAGSARTVAEGDFRSKMPRWQGEALAQNVRLLDALTKLADEHGCTPAQLALAWLLHQGEYIVPIPGTKRVALMEENVAAADIKLTTQDLAAIEQAIPKTAVQGERYDEAGFSLIESR